MGIAGVNPPDFIDAFIILIICSSAASVYFRCADSLACILVIIGSFAAELMLAAYFLASVSDSSRPLA